MNDVKRMCRIYLEARPGRYTTKAVEVRQKHCRTFHGMRTTEWCVDFEKCLNKLDKLEAALLLLVYGAGYHRTEAAKITRIHVNTVRTRLMAAEAKLAAAVDEAWYRESTTNIVPMIKAVAARARQ